MDLVVVSEDLILCERSIRALRTFPYVHSLS